MRVYEVVHLYVGVHAVQGVYTYEGCVRMIVIACVLHLLLRWSRCYKPDVLNFIQGVDSWYPILWLSTRL